MHDPTNLLPRSRTGATAATPRLLLLARDSLGTRSDEHQAHRLLTVRFADAASLDAPGCRREEPAPDRWLAAAPLAQVDSRILERSAPSEAWLSDVPVSRGRHGPVDWSDNGRALFGAISTRLAGDLSAETSAHFTALLAAIEERKFPYLMRVWNFLPGINARENGSERYHLFNCGRAAAFDDRYGITGAEARFSASSAVGCHGDCLVTFFAAARCAALHLGNPRQVHAFRYPTSYGPRPPSFSRATVSPPELGNLLFLSGTASIAGHETRHVGMLDLQLQETLLNIETLLASHARLPSLEEFDLVRVYLRDAGDSTLVHDLLRRRLGPRPLLHFVEADICRAELLLEIEGVAGLAGAAQEL
jgi:chorismate lyase / 3-hydroxybenzoate synthase